MVEEDRRTDLLLFGIKFPTKIGVFERGEVTNNEFTHSGLGHTIAYGGTSIGKATILVYDKELSDIPDGPTEPLIRNEFDEATQDVLDAFQNLEDRTIEIVDQYVTGGLERGAEFLCSEFLVRFREGAQRTFLYVSGAKEKFIKLRVTLASDNPSNPTPREFADAVAGLVWD